MLLQRIDEVWLRDECMLHVTEHLRLFVYYVGVNVLNSYCRLVILITYTLSTIVVLQTLLFVIKFISIFSPTMV